MNNREENDFIMERLKRPWPALNGLTITQTMLLGIFLSTILIMDLSYWILNSNTLLERGPLDLIVCGSITLDVRI